MGTMTRDAIITQGMLLAGKSTTNLATLVGTSFDAWLRSTYKAWLWPFLNLQSSAITLASGATTLAVGRTSGSALTDRVDDIFDPIYLYTSDYKYLGRARVRQIRGGPAESEPSILDPTKNLGVPLEFKSRPSSTVEGLWALTPQPFPDKAYLVRLDYKLWPESVSGSQTPRYENDRTMIQAAKTFALEWSKDDEYMNELKLLADMVMQDFAKDASKTGTNDVLALNTNTFK